MGVIKIKTTVPGPKSKKLDELHKKHLPAGYERDVPFFIDHAQGAQLTDVDGNVFLDFGGGYGALNAGHVPESVLSAITEQSAKLLHTCYGLAGYESFLRAAEKLNAIIPIQGPKKTVFFNSGAEAVENAVKAVRAYTKKPAVVAFNYGFHGRTLLTLSMTSKVKPYKLNFGPFAPEIYHLEYPYSYRRPVGQSEKQYVESLLTFIEGEFFAGVVDPDHIAGVVFEPLAGEGGYIVPPASYVRGLARICQKYKIPLIVDEVQTGFYRTGKRFCIEHFGVKPDIICTAKSIAAGMPLSAVTGKKEIMDAVHPAGFGGTFSGNPVSCAASVATLDFMEKERLDLRANKIDKIFMPVLQKLQKTCKHVGDVRGLGAMKAIEFVQDKKSKKPDSKIISQIIREAYNHGVVLVGAGLYANVIRFIPPLVISDAELREGLAVIERAVKKFAR